MVNYYAAPSYLHDYDFKVVQIQNKLHMKHIINQDISLNADPDK